MERLWMNKKAMVGCKERAIGQKGYTLLYRQVAAARGEVLYARQTRWYEWVGKRKTLDCFRQLKRPREVG